MSSCEVLDLSIGSDISESVSLPSMSEARDLCAGVVYDQTKIIVLGGYNGIAILPTVEVFDIVNNAWTKLPPMPTARGLLAAGVAGSSILAFGGSSNWFATSTVELLDMTTLQWKTVTSMNYPRFNHGGTVMRLSPTSHHMIAAVGYQRDTGETYNFATDKWTLALPHLRHGLHAFRRLVWINDKLVSGCETHLEILDAMIPNESINNLYS